MFNLAHATLGSLTASMHPHFSGVTMTGFLPQAMRAELRRLMLLGAPLIGAQLLQMGNGLVDTLVAGQLGREALAAAGIGAAVWFIVALSCIGLLASISPVIAHMRGQGRQLEIGAVIRQGLWLAVFWGFISLGLVWLLANSLEAVGISEELSPSIKDYLGAAAWGLPAIALLSAARNVCEATARTRPVLLVQVLGLIINIFGDLGFGLGWFGLPALGLAGIGWSTTIVMVCMAATLLFLLSRTGFKRYQIYSRWQWPDIGTLKLLLGLSIPICMAMMFEAGLFTATAVQMGVIGVLPASAHNIAIGVTSFCFMLPLGLSAALTARIGQSLGKGSLKSIRLRINAGLIATITMASSTALMLILLRHWLPSLYTDDVPVKELAAQMLLFAAIFQLSDGTQVALFGILRGLQDTKMPMIINGFAYWVIAFGLGYYLAHYTSAGAFGLWIGLVVGLSISSLLLFIRLRIVLRQKQLLLHR